MSVEYPTVVPDYFLQQRLVVCGHESRRSQGRAVFGGQQTCSIEVKLFRIDGELAEVFLPA